MRTKSEDILQAEPVGIVRTRLEPRPSEGRIAYARGDASRHFSLFTFRFSLILLTINFLIMNMRKVFCFALVFLLGITASVNAQVNIGSQKDAHSGALLELDATSVKKGLLLPRIAIEDVTVWGLEGSHEHAAGMIVFNTIDKKVYVWNGNKWTPMGEGQTTPIVVAVAGVSVTPTEVSLTEIGAKTQLVATVDPDNATNQAVTWSSDKPGVATVDENGLVAAKANGTATITVKTVDGEMTATCAITVSAPVTVTGVSVTPMTETLTAIGATLQLTPTVSPSNATNKNVTWSSDKTSVATVSPTGLVTAVANGTAIITARTADGGKTATSTITVDIATIVTSVDVTPKSANLTKFGATVQLTATVFPSEAPQAVVWSTNKPSVATVTQDGLVTAISDGMAVITAATADGEIVSPKVGITVNATLTDCPGYRAVGGEYTTAKTGNLKIPEHTAFETLISAEWGFESTGNDLCFYKKDGTDSSSRWIDDCTSGDFVDAEDRIVRWRLPNIVELGAIQPIYNSLDSQPTSATGTTNLQDGVYSSYWSNTSYDGYEWIIWNYKKSYTNKSLGSNVGAYLRCVKSMEPTTPTGVAVTGVNIDPTEVSLTSIGTTQQLTATVAPANATNKNVTWSSSDESVAIVTQDGLVTAVMNGTSIITVTTKNGNETAAATITVNAPLADCPGYLAVGGEYTGPATTTFGENNGVEFSVVANYFTATGNDLCFYKRDVVEKEIKYSVALTACSNSSYFDADADATHWRLPNIAELGAINDIERSDVGLGGQETSASGTVGFKRNTSYWSSTVKNDDEAWRWSYNFSYASYYGKAYYSSTRCVRSLTK